MGGRYFGDAGGLEDEQQLGTAKLEEISGGSEVQKMGRNECTAEIKREKECVATENMKC